MTIEHKTTPPPPKKKKEQATIWKIINDHRAQNHSPLPPPKKERKTKEKVVKIQGPKWLSSVSLLWLSVMHAHVVAQKKFH